MDAKLSALLDRFLPLHAQIAPDGTIAHAGPTLAKICPAGLVGQQIRAAFDIRWPASASGPASLEEIHSRRIRLRFKAPPHTTFRGLALRYGDNGAMVLDLSFGIALPDAVTTYGLTAADFAETDLAVEMLFLAEAQAAAISEWRKLTHRLETERSSAEARAETDPLTGLLNRRGLDRTAENLIGSARPFSLIAIDLDYLKRVNDVEGHAAGDRALIRATQAIRRATRQRDTIARTGGDEFVILLPGVSGAATARRIAERIVAEITEQPVKGRPDINLSASAGISVSTAYRKADFVTMLRDADIALYKAKAEGRSRVCLAEPAA